MRAAAAVTFLNGLLGFVDILNSRLTARIQPWLPIHYDYDDRQLSVFAGFLLIYFSGRLLRRKRLAWWVAIIATLILTAHEMAHGHPERAVVVLVGELYVLLRYRALFNVRSEITNVWQGVRLLLISLLVAVAYGAIGFAALVPRDFVPQRNISLLEGAQRTAREFTLIGNDDLVPRTRHARWFLDSLDLLGVVSISFAFYSLFRPLTHYYGVLPAERQRARGVLEAYGNSSEDAFKLWPEDKDYYFLSSGSSFVSYRVERGVALVLGEPVGPQAQWPHLINEFRSYCHQHDWDVAFIYVSAAALAMFESAGWRSLKIGEDAVVETNSFATKTAHSRHFRGVVNKFERLGYNFEYSAPPQSVPVLRQMAGVERSWLRTPGRRERGFGLGFYDTGYLRRSPLFLLRDPAGQLVAFANEVHSYDPLRATVDLMRQRQQGETGAMDYLLTQIIGHFAAAGVPEFNLGLAPLAGVGGSAREPSLEERIIGMAARLGIGGFSYEGLRRFKNKFEPGWEPRYLVYERGPAGLARTATAVKAIVGSQPSADPFAPVPG